MFDLSDICSLCLVLSENLQNILNQDTDGIVIEDKLRMVLMELVNFKPNISKFICKDCLETVNNVHKFREKCLKNIVTLNKYVQKSEASSQSRESCSNSQDHFVGVSEQKHIIDTFEVSYEEFEPCNEDKDTEENINTSDINHTIGEREPNSHSTKLVQSESSLSALKESLRNLKKYERRKKQSESSSDSETDSPENSSLLLSKKREKLNSTQETQGTSNFMGVNENELVFVTQQNSVQFNDFAENSVISRLNQLSQIDNNESDVVPKDVSIDVIMRNQIQIESKLSNLNKVLDSFLKTSIPTFKQPDSLVYQLPLQTFEAFLSFESYLTNESNFQDMFSYFKGMCTNNLGKSLNEMLRELFTNKLAMEFNYYGKKPKNKFHGSKTDKLLYCTARHTFQCSFQEYKEQAMKWLKYAPQRDKFKKHIEANYTQVA